MSSTMGLWSRSIAWRWVTSVTLLAIATVLLVNPWRVPVTTQSLASYTTPTHSPKVPGYTPNPQSNQTSTPSRFRNQPSLSSTDIFDVAIDQPVAAYSLDTELHLVGLYEGARADGKSDEPWWSKCVDNISELSETSRQDIRDCHLKYAGQKTQHTVTVNISRDHPMILVLMAYDPVLWKIKTNDFSKIKRVILGGYHGQDIAQIPDNIPVDVYSYETSTCKICTRKSGSMYAYKEESKEYRKVLNSLKKITGLSPTSFQGTYRSHYFSVSNSTISAGERRILIEQRKKQDPYTGVDFYDSVKLAGETLPLPEGVWHGIVFNRTSSSQGIDELLVLANYNNRRLNKLMAARVRTEKNDKGFITNSSCSKKSTYVTNTESNKPHGKQSCYWVEHLTSPWEKSVFKLASQRISANGLNLPSTVINSGFHYANTGMSKTIYFYMNPEEDGYTTPPSDWFSSPWHPDRLKSNTGIQQAVDNYKQWAKNWFQIIKKI